MVAYCYLKAKAGICSYLCINGTVSPRLAAPPPFSYDSPHVDCRSDDALHGNSCAPMQLDLAHNLGFELRSCGRSCAATARSFNPGEVYFSVLETSEHDFVRRDYSIEAWQGQPAECVGWWRSRIPTKDDNQPRLAPTDVLLNLFETLENRPNELEFRYLLGLLLLRRKVVRREETFRDDQGREILTLHCQRRQKEYELAVAEPAADQAMKLQQQMFDLLYGNCDVTTDPAPTGREPS
jgi:hypothetical protein